jgi:3-deoxy-alpha-D-manno-octulosonate 8-oxidase
MRAVEEFYPEQYQEFWRMVENQKIHIRSGVASKLDHRKMHELYDAMIVHEKPLANALGEDFKDILTKEKVFQLYQRM